MPTNKLHRFGVAQLSYNPAFLNESGVSCLQEPVFPSDDSRGLYKLEDLREIHDLRLRIAAQHTDHISHKLRALVEFASQRSVELLLLPEYSVPSELLEECRALSKDHGIVIVAGSHIATRSAIKEHIRLGMAPASSAGKIGRSVCPVFLPSGGSHLFEKVGRSKAEGSVIGGVDSGPVMVSLGGENILLEVMICIDAIREQPARQERKVRSSPRLTVIPSLTPTTDLFYKKAELLLAAGRVSLFANVAEFGGSKVFARAESAAGWLTAADGVGPVAKGGEALILASVDLGGQFVVRKSTEEHFPVQGVSVAPIIYANASDSCKEYVGLIENLKDLPDKDTEQAQANLKPFTTIEYKSFPRLMQEKLKHFLANVAGPGLGDAAAWREWLTPVVIHDTESPDAIRYSLCEESIGLVHELGMSEKYSDKAESFGDIYKYLMSKLSELRTRVALPLRRPAAQVTAASEEPRGAAQDIGAFEPPFFDREIILGTLQKFINSVDKTCFALAGMRGIGKTSIAREAFKRVVPPTWKRVWISLTEGASYPRLLAEFAHQFGVRFPSEASLDSPIKQIDLAQNILLSLSHTPRLCVVLDDFQYLLEPNGEFRDENAGKFLSDLIGAIHPKGNKILLVTNHVPKLVGDLNQLTESRHITGVERGHAENLFSYWYRFEREGLSQLPVTFPEKLLGVLNGHPLALKIAAKLVAEGTAQKLESEAAIFRKLREAIISFFLDRVDLSPLEDELVRFASVFRLPVGRDAFITWKADQAGQLLDSLLGRSLLETDGEVYGLHPIIREHFYTSTPFSALKPFHKIAGFYFLERYKKTKAATGEANPELLGEAIHHYLCAGEREKVKSFALYRHELRPVALSHYRRQDYPQALKDYRLLLALDSSDYDAHFHLCLLYARNKSWDEAEDHFGKAMRLKPNAYWVLYGFGHAKLVANRVPEAEQLLREAYDINPRHCPTLTDLGRISARRGDEHEAEDYFHRAIEADPNNTFAYFSYARFLLDVGRAEEGLQMANAAVETNPRDDRNKRLVDEIRNRIREASEGPGSIKEPQ